MKECPKRWLAQKECILKIYHMRICILNYLLKTAIPSRFMENFGFKNLFQTIILLISIFAVLTGYVSYKLGD